MINFSFIIFNNSDHCIKESIKFSSSWFFSLNYIYALKTKWNIIPIDKNIGVISFKLFWITRWWIETKSFMNENICILKLITDIYNSGSEYMHSFNRNIGSEWVIIFHWTVVSIKINTFDLITPIFTVACKMFPCIKTVTFLNTRRNGWIYDFFPFREWFYWYWSLKKDGIFVLVILHK